MTQQHSRPPSISILQKEKPGSPFHRAALASMLQTSIVCDCPANLSRFYALNELPQPQVVLACGFLMEKPEPCTLST